MIFAPELPAWRAPEGDAAAGCGAGAAPDATGDAPPHVAVAQAPFPRALGHRQMARERQRERQRRFRREPSRTVRLRLPIQLRPRWTGLRAPLRPDWQSRGDVRARVRPGYPGDGAWRSCCPVQQLLDLWVALQASVPKRCREPVQKQWNCGCRAAERIAGAQFIVERRQPTSTLWVQ